MALTKLIPSIFYADLAVGRELFERGLGLALRYEELGGPQPFCILGKDAVEIHLVQNATLAALDRPQIRLETDDIHALFAEVQRAAPGLLHPNGNRVTQKPWGLLEFALLDASQVCVIVQQPA
ncbi:hypothetical protein [Hymenobacter sp. PAMC 26628]|uniref:hypothetical protein n=1 Tax=Hymenobacter sp. PAMC 26628 TaxID=1484118 RepID=UPI0007703384|nr:hypothetical protein [Hymenobacter sp. PAMC 26628]AMJ66154.1 hypothetical protein AXW84_12465 [Hymenobacter sp. PAMC 26628]